MIITRIPFEDRWYVQSRSRTDILHIVDLAYQADRSERPRPGCSCERWMCHDELCAHIKAVVQELSSQYP